MNIGLSELVLVVVNGILILGIPVVLVYFAVLLLRRMRDLEARVARLEDMQDSPERRPEESP